MGNSFIERIKEIMIVLDCSVIEALEVIKVEKEIQQ